MVEAWAVRLRYTPLALAELEQILNDIAAQSPQGARRVQARLQAMTQLLLQFPNSGQLTNIPTMRRIVATPYPYLIFYQHTKYEVIIVGVRHGARDPSTAPGRV